MKFYTKDELKLFLELCDERLPHQWAVFFRLLAYTGIRRGEVLVLTWDDLDEQAHTIRICKTVTHGEGGAYISDTPKTDKSSRTIMIDDETLRQVQTLPRDYDFIFPNTKGSYTTPSMVETVGASRRQGRLWRRFRGLRSLTAVFRVSFFPSYTRIRTHSFFCILGRAFLSAFFHQ